MGEERERERERERVLFYMLVIWNRTRLCESNLELPVISEYNN